MKFIRNVILAIAISFTLVACDNQKKIEIATVPVERVELILPQVQPLKLDPIKWAVITEENITETFDQLENSGEQRAMFSLSARDYQALSINFARITGHIIQLNNIINSYDNYYKKQQDNVEPSRY